MATKNESAENRALFRGAGAALALYVWLTAVGVAVMAALFSAALVLALVVDALK